MHAPAVSGFDVARARGLYLSVGTGPASLDGPLSTLQPESVVRAIITALRSAPTQPGSTSPRSLRSAESLVRAQRAFADLVGAGRDSLVLGAGLPALHRHVAELVSRDWRLGDEILLSRLDSDAVLVPWTRAARAAGVSVRIAELDLETGELPSWQYHQLITERTRLVTVPLGNPATGTIPDVAAIAERAHDIGALVLCDVGAAAVHLPLDIRLLGADLMALAATSFGGPTVAAVIGRPGLRLDLRDDRSLLGPLPVELLDGASAAVDHLADLDEHAQGTRRERLAESVSAAGAHTAGLWEQFADGVGELAHVTVLGGVGPRLPALAFTVAGRTPEEVGAFLGTRGLSVWTGPSGMTQLLQAFGADECGGAVFAGFMPHTTPAEVDQLLGGLRALR